MTPKQVCAQHGITIADFMSATGESRSNMADMLKSKPRRFELLCKGVALELSMTILEKVETECWDIRCIDLDDSWMWQVVGHYMGDKPYRVLGESWERDGMSKAIEQAIETTKDDPYNYLYEFNG